MKKRHRFVTHLEVIGNGLDVCGNRIRADGAPDLSWLSAMPSSLSAVPAQVSSRALSSVLDEDFF